MIGSYLYIYFIWNIWQIYKEHPYWKLSLEEHGLSSNTHRIKDNKTLHIELQSKKHYTEIKQQSAAKRTKDNKAPHRELMTTKHHTEN
jgi:hypothetical protein